MDFRAITDLLLQAGQQLAQKGQTTAERKLDIPESGPERDTALQSLGRGAAAGSLLALLLGTQAGRRLTGAGLRLGSLAALGGLAYRAYQNWQGQQGAVGAGTPVDQLAGPEAERRSLALLRAMIAAAKADGHIDDAERARIDQQLASLALDRDSQEFFREELAKPLSAKEVAAGADSPAAAAEIYLASLMAIDEQNETERGYLRELAGELGLAPDLVSTLEEQARA